MGDSIVRKTDRVLNNGDDVVVCLPGAKREAITGRVENIVGSGKGGYVLVHIGTNNVEREGTTAIVRKYRKLVRTLKQTRVEQVILSGILPVIGRMGQRYVCIAFSKVKICGSLKTFGCQKVINNIL